MALELFFSKIWVMSIESKLDFCEFLDQWAGTHHNKNDENEHDNNNDYEIDQDCNKGRILLPWELLGPCLRILGHCMLGGEKEELLLREKAYRACKSLYNRATHDVNPKAILAVGSLLRLVKMDKELDEVDYTEIHNTRVISI